MLDLTFLAHRFLVQVKKWEREKEQSLGADARECTAKQESSTNQVLDILSLRIDWNLCANHITFRQSCRSSPLFYLFSLTELRQESARESISCISIAAIRIYISAYSVLAEFATLAMKSLVAD